MTVDSRSVAFHNADVWTMNLRNDRASAVLIVDGKVAVVGGDDEILAAVDGTEIPLIDARGRTLLPGFLDAHTHLELTACSNEYWLQAHTPPHPSLESVKEAIRGQLATVEYGGWLTVRSSFGMHAKVDEQRLLTRQELDELSPNRPLAVAAGLHVMSLNTVAMEELGILDAVSTPQMVIHRDEQGAATGVATEVWDRFPPFGADDVRDALRKQVPDVATRFGVMTAGSISYERVDSDIAKELADEGLPLRVRSYLHVPRVASLDDVLAMRVDSTQNTAGTGIAGVKIFVDGQNGDGLDATFHDFKWDQASLNLFVSRATEGRVQVLMHAVSPEALRMALTALELASDGRGNSLRHRIEHGGDYLDVADLERIRKAGAILITTPQFIASTQGEETSAASPLRTILDAGVPLAAGTDTTGTVPEGASPLFNIACAVHRAGPGQTAGTRENITFTEAVRLFTTSAAYALFAENELGQIQPGFAGDVVMLDRPVDSVTSSSEYFELSVIGVWFAGRQVHSAQAGSQANSAGNAP